MDKQVTEMTGERTAIEDAFFELLMVLAKIKSDLATIEKNTSSMDDNNGGRIKF